MTQEAHEIAVRWGVPIAIAFLAVLARAVMTSPKPTLWGLVRGTIIGMFVGSVTLVYLADVQSISDGTRGAIVGLSAILAEDIVIALLAGGREIRKNPSLLWDFIIRRKP